MNKKLYLFVLLVLFTVPVKVGFAQLNIPIPEPVCVSVPGIPCDNNNNEPAKKTIVKNQNNKDLENFQKNASKLYKYLSENIKKIKEDIIKGWQNIYDGLRKKKQSY